MISGVGNLREVMFRLSSFYGLVNAALTKAGIA